MKLIAETAWHHEGDFDFMKNLVTEICNKSSADIVKMHITLNYDEYMDKSHSLYELVKTWLFNEDQWCELINIVRSSKKELMLLLNDEKAIEFGTSQSPEYVEIHSVCLNDIFLLDSLKKHLNKNVKLVLGVGGTDIEEIDHAINYIKHENTLLMFGFQNFPTVYKDVNLNKVRRIIWDNDNNQLITLLGAASGMSFVEKHVTTKYGEERIDWSAAISIDMFNELSDKLQVLNDLNGDGELQMNQGEIAYSIFGPMKKAAVFGSNVKKGDVFSKEMIKFRRTENISDMSQINIIQAFGKVLAENVRVGQVVMHSSFE